MRKCFLSLVLVAISTLLVAQQSLNNDAVIKLVKAGLSDDLIVSTINAQPGTYDTTTDGLIALKTAGASDKVVSAIVTKAAASAAASPQPSASSSMTGKSLSSSSAPDETSEGKSSGKAPISAGARIVIAPMGGFETYFAAAVREKKVPVTLTLDRNSAQYFVVSTDTQWQGFVYGSGAAWSSAGGASGATAGTTRGLEASIMLIDATTKDVIWAYEVHKNSHGSILFGTLGARGEQSVAEACAKHLKEYIETGK